MQICIADALHVDFDTRARPWNPLANDPTARHWISAPTWARTKSSPCAEGAFSRRKVRNRRAELSALLRSLPAGSRIGMESTGSYHELLAETAHKLGLVIVVLNRVGFRGKTNRVDAELIARMVAREHERLHP